MQSEFKTGKQVAAGTWVEVHNIVLAAGDRAPQVPDDTQKVALEMCVKGFLTHPAAPGQVVEIRTMAGRYLRGVLVRVNPGYTHGFGDPVPELLTIGEEARQMLRAQEQKGE